MSASITLTTEEQWSLNNALRLENAGFTQAAQWLRDQILVLRGIKWDDSKGEAPIVHDAKAWKALFRAHRGSIEPFLPKKDISPYPASQPIPIPHFMRDDQIKA